jgi:hypothetical protein
MLWKNTCPHCHSGTLGRSSFPRRSRTHYGGAASAVPLRELREALLPVQVGDARAVTEKDADDDRELSGVKRKKHGAE